MDDYESLNRRASSFSLTQRADELSVEGRDPSIELGPLRPSVGDENDHP
jgi:hypothetical protein